MKAHLVYKWNNNITKKNEYKIRYFQMISSISGFIMHSATIAFGLSFIPVNGAHIFGFTEK